MPQSHISRRFTENGQAFLQVTADHAISEDWLQANTPELYRIWCGAVNPVRRDAIARHIDARFARIESADDLPADRRLQPECAALNVLIDDYEAGLIARPGTQRGGTADFAAVTRHIAAHGLTAHPLAVDLELRDWAEQNAPSLLAAWQRAVVVAGSLDGGDDTMRAIRSAHRQSALARPHRDPSGAPLRLVPAPTLTSRPASAPRR